jgi:hypothetical protein
VEKARKLVKELWISKYARIPIQSSGSVDLEGASRGSTAAKVSIIKRITPLNKLTNIGKEAFPTARAP